MNAPGPSPDRTTAALDHVHRQRFDVAFAYPVHFTRGALAPASGVLAGAVSRLEPDRRHRVLAFVDEGVARGRPTIVDEIHAYAGAHADRLELVAEPAVEPGGEAAKNDPEALERLHAILHRHRLDRQCFVLAIGGGAMLDVVGYAAATTHRGVRLIRMPTTVLAQNDAGVGVKNGVNSFGVKNFQGAFAPPFAVVNDVELLATLQERDKRAGLAEAVKVALIRDGAFFAELERRAGELARFDEDALAWSIRRTATLHLEHIAGCGDPFEAGNARPLDHGHWSAHKLETLSEHALRHGEAVAIGLALDARYAVREGRLPAGAGERVLALLEALGFRLWHDALDASGADGRRRVLWGLEEFREHLGGELSITLLEELGRGVDVDAVDEALVERAIADLRERDAGRSGEAAAAS